MDQHQKYMHEALRMAKKAASLGEVPVGAILVHRGEIIAEAHNLVEERSDATAHAEILLLQKAGKLLGDWRLSEAALYVTLEPCVMCIGAILNARVKELYFAAYDKRQGAAGSLFDLSQHSEMYHQVEVYPELCREESEKLLKSFFQELRYTDSYTERE